MKIILLTKIYFHENLIEVHCTGSNSQLVSIGWDNGLAPVRRQAIIWTNDGSVDWQSVLWQYVDLSGFCWKKLFLGAVET